MNLAVEKNAGRHKHYILNKKELIVASLVTRFVSNLQSMSYVRLLPSLSVSLQFILNLKDIHEGCLNTTVSERGGFALLGINDEKQVTKLFVWTDRFVRSA